MEKLSNIDLFENFLVVADDKSVKEIAIKISDHTVWLVLNGIKTMFRKENLGIV